MSPSVYIGVKAGWDAYVDDHEVKASTRNAIDAAAAGIGVLCTNPNPDNTTSTIAKVMAAAATVIINLQREDPNVAHQTVAAAPRAELLLQVGQTADQRC